MLMTGKDLIIYILENDLENEQVFKDGELLGFMSVDLAALKFGVGTTTIKVWADLNIIPYIKIGDTIYIPANSVKKEDNK
jgi:hypothetical protein